MSPTFNGVTPRILPSTSTLAPGGVDFTSSEPVVGTSGTGGVGAGADRGLVTRSGSFTRRARAPNAAASIRIAAKSERPIQGGTGRRLVWTGALLDCGGAGCGTA